ncbi:MAG TPA: endonuclease MutS2 [Nitrospirales bacterium]|nr:endonuclease MutS2 [Nitrospirales bacterium]
MTKLALLRKAETVLEWDVLLDLLAKHASSPMGADLCRSLRLADHIADAKQLLGETGEMLTLQDRKEGFSLMPFPDLHPMLNRLEKGGTLETGEFHQISVLLGQVVEVKAKLVVARASIPLLYSRADVLSNHAQLKKAIDHCIDEEGHIRPTATPELSKLMDAIRSSKERIRKRIDAMLNKPKLAELLQEQYFDLRANRYVLPVRAECRSQVPGIVHDVSASGATVFIEPRELVERNNQMKVAEIEVEREIRKILNELAQRLVPHTGSIADDLVCLAQLDCIAAKATFSRLLDAKPVGLNTEGRIQLDRARHPLLVFARLRAQAAEGGVIPNDLYLDGSVRGLVISGPNAGGKTVTLKLLGLFALMVRAGLLLPCDPGSEMGLFPEVYADIGDAQDLSRDLSSFSAHITQMIWLLRHAAPGALVLLDEPVTSTDPTEGAALAEALLLRLTEQKMKVVVTTHYPRLKVLAQSRPGFLNASAEFDVSTLSPTYRVLFGMPGGSSAIDIAGRLGMDETLLEDALDRAKQGTTSEDEQKMTRIVDELQQRQRRLEEELRRAQVAREESERSADAQRETTEQIQQAERELKKDARRKVVEEFAMAKRRIHQLLEETKKEKSSAVIKTAKQQLAAIERETTERLSDLDSRVPLDQLQAGDHVDITPLGVVGILCEPPQSNRRVRVRIGERELSVDVDQLGGRVKEASIERATDPSTMPRNTSSRVAMDLGEEVLDVRGKYADDALYEMTNFLDQASLTNASLVRVIHGHGTGKLKQVLRDYLKESPYVEGFRPGDRNEGGDGVTIVDLK